jgi:hypothetical protein
MVGHEYGSSTGFIGVTGYSTGGVPIDDNRTPADYNCVKYRGGRRSYRKSKGRKGRKSHRKSRKGRKSRKQRGGSSGNGGYGFVLDNQYTGKFYDSLARGPCPTPQRGGVYPVYPPQIFQHKMSYNALTDAVSTNSAHYANRGANPSYCGGTRRNKKVKGRKHRKH